MKKLITGLVLGMALSGCALESIGDDLNDAIADAKFQAKADKVFAQAISQVTSKVVSSVFADDSTEETAPKFVVAAAETVEIDETETLDNGGTATIKGSITIDEESDTKTTATIDVEITWTNLVVTIDGENGEEEVSTNGNMKFTGTIVIDLSSETAPFTLTFTQAGTITLDGQNVTFNVTTTWDGGETMEVVGTVNGQPYNRTVTVGALGGDDEEEEPVLSCVEIQYGDDCIDYYGSSYVGKTCADIDAAYEEASGACADDTTAGWVGVCLIDEDGIEEREHFYNTDQSSTCVSSSGNWSTF